MSSASVTDRAFILHRYPYRETSVILECFTEHHGRVPVVAKGVKRPKSLLKGLLQPFTVLQLAWGGKSQLKYLTGADALAPPLLLAELPMYAAFYMNECLLRLLHREEACEYLFQTYERCLQTIGEKNQLEPSLRLFEKKLLETLGYALPLTFTAIHHQPIVADEHYDYISEHGFEVAPSHRGAFHGKDLLRIAEEQFDDPEVLKAAKRLFRMALSPLFGDKPLKSRELLKTLYSK